jgi:pilus assembly protein CpaB
MDTSATSRLGRRLRHVAWRARFVVAAICCGLAATTTVQALRPPPAPVGEVVVTARAVEAGTRLTAGDMTTLTVDLDLVPALLTDLDEVIGRSAAVPLPAGVPLHGALVTGGGLASQAPEGTVVVAVRLVESAWLRPGDRVDLLAADDGGTRLARRALVLPGQDTAAAGAQSSGLLDGVRAGPQGEEVTLLAVDPDEAADVSATSGWGATVAVLVP